MPAPHEVDAAILSATSTNWSKVAMVIARVSRIPALVWQEEEDEFEVIAGRVQAMVRAGTLVAEGDLSKWRHSEVRQP